MILFIFLIFFSTTNASLIQPHNLDTLSKIHVLFEWEQEPNALGYNFKISTDEFFNDIILDTNIYNIVYINKDNLEWDNEYYWKVKPIFEDNVFGDWIGQNSFFISNKVYQIDLIQSNVNNGNDLIIFGDTYRKKSAVFDKNGKEIWNASDNSSFSVQNIDDYGLLFGHRHHNDESETYSTFNFNNSSLWETPHLLPYEINWHEFKLLPNGNYVFFVKEIQYGPIPIGDWTSQFQALGYEADGMTNEFPWMGYKIIELDSDTKEEIWIWNVFNHYSMNDYDYIGGTWWNALIDGYYDWTHVNALDFNDELDFLYISNRQLSRITKLNYPNGDIIWNMGLSEEYHSGDNNICTELNFSWQHHISILDNGNLLFFDNGNLSNIIRNTNYSTSRILEIEVLENQICNIIWEYDLPEHLFGSAMGSVQKLKNGNYLINTRGDFGHIIEVNSEKQIIWDCKLNNNLYDDAYGGNYRAFNIPGINPHAFSIIFNNLENINIGTMSYPGIVLSDDNTFSIEVKNESGYFQDYKYTLNDDMSYFNSTEETISLEPYESKTLTFQSKDINMDNFTSIHCNIIPINHPYAEKDITIYVSKSYNNLIEDFEFSKIYPNPFNASSNIIFNVPYESEVKISVYNIKGQLLETLFRKRFDEGRYEVTWDAKNYSNGVYLIKMISDNFMETKKITLIK